MLARLWHVFEPISYLERRNMLQLAGRAERRPTGDANGRDKDPTPTTQTQAQGASGSVPIAAFTRPRLLLLESLWPAAAHWPLLCVAAPLITPPVPKCLLCPVHSLPRWAHTSLGPCRRACSPVPAEGKGCRRVRRGARARNETDDDPRAEAYACSPRKQWGLDFPVPRFLGTCVGKHLLLLRQTHGVGPTMMTVGF